MNLLQDEDFRKILLRFLCRDRNFLKSCGHLLSADDFKPTAQSTSNEIWLVASWALEYYQERGEPIGGLLRSQAIEKADDLRFGAKQTRKLLELIKEIQNPTTDVIAVDAVQEKVVRFKKSKAKQRAMEKLIELQERSELTDERWYEVTTEANKMFEVDYKAIDFLGDPALEARQKRRAEEGLVGRNPFLMIDPYDMHFKSIGRGMMGMILAFLKSGKTLAMEWIALAYAWQGLKVLFFTLEDPAYMVEDAMDACITHLPIKKMKLTPRKLRNRFKRMRQLMHGRIKIIDGTEGGITTRRIEEIWELERNRGFVADVILIDYDDEIVALKKNPERRFEFADIYRELRRFAAKRDLFLWIASQTGRATDGKRIITAKDVAEDISKIRKVALCLGIGDGEWGDNSKYISIVASKIDVQKRGFNIMTAFEKGMFYDRDATLRRMEEEGSGVRA